MEEEALAKYRRLSREASQLQEEVGRASSREEGLSEATLATLGVEVDLLHRHLLSLRLEEVVGQGGTRETQDPPARQKLLAQLEGLKAPAPGSGSQGSSSTYSLHLRPATGGLVELAARLAGLEARVGGGEELEVLCRETGGRSLVQAAAVLASRVALLDPLYLEHVEGRLAALQHKLQQAPGPTLPTGALAGLDSLAAAAERVQGLYAGLGGTVARVESLQALHAGAAGVAASLLELEAEQEHLAATLHNNLALVAAARKQVPVNMAAIEANFASLTARVERLQGMH